MKCSKCGKEMRKGYLFCSKDGAFSFANEVPGVFQNAKKADGFVEGKICYNVCNITQGESKCLINYI